jgi:hypothetical protein
MAQNLQYIPITSQEYDAREAQEFLDDAERELKEQIEEYELGGFGREKKEELEMEQATSVESAELEDVEGLGYVEGDGEGDDASLLPTPPPTGRPYYYRHKYVSYLLISFLI